MSKPTIKFDELTRFAPETLLIRGKVQYSHISRKYEGDELKKVNERRATKKMKPSNTPFCDITVRDAFLINPEGYDPVLRKGIEERFYKQTDESGANIIMWRSSSTAPNLPMVAYSADAGTDLEGHGIADKDVPLKAELANGLDVTLGVKLFTNQNGTGLGLDFVLVNEPIRYYSNDGLASVLAAAGITYIPPVIPEGKKDTVPVSVSPMARVIPEAVPQENMVPEQPSIQLMPSTRGGAQNMQEGRASYDPRIAQMKDQVFLANGYVEQMAPDIAVNQTMTAPNIMPQQPHLDFTEVKLGQLPAHGIVFNPN